MNIAISYKKLLYFFENDKAYPIDETTFYFDDAPDEELHYIGCLREYEKPYWAGYCDVPDGCDFSTAAELFTAKIYNHQSIQDRWEHLVLVSIGGLSAESWIECHCT